jgi:hypothetical protein
MPPARGPNGSRDGFSDTPGSIGIHRRGVADYEGISFDPHAGGIVEPFAIESGPVGDLCGWI